MSDGCSKSHLEMVRLVRFRTVSDDFLYMTAGKRMRFLMNVLSWRLSAVVLETSPSVYICAIKMFVCLFVCMAFEGEKFARCL